MDFGGQKFFYPRRIYVRKPAMSLQFLSLLPDMICFAYLQHRRGNDTPENRGWPLIVNYLAGREGEGVKRHVSRNAQFLFSLTIIPNLFLAAVQFDINRV